MVLFNKVHEKEKNMKKTLTILSIIVINILCFPLSVYADSSDTIVYRTRTGECYHKDGCGSLSKSKIEITLGEAVESELRPCGNCHPPILDEPSYTETERIQPLETVAPTQTATPTPEINVERSPSKEDNDNWNLPIGIVLGAGAITVIDKLRNK